MQARNFMRDMKVGQGAFFYHSNCKEPGIIGVIKVGSFKMIPNRLLGLLQDLQTKLKKF